MRYIKRANDFLKKRAVKRTLKIILILIVPLILTIVVSDGNKETYEFVNKEGTRMVAPSAPHPYLSNLFSDTFQQLGTSWHKFCIQNNSYSIEYNLPHDLAYRIGDKEDFSRISYGVTKCIPIHKSDIFYDVAWGGFTIPTKEKMLELCGSADDNCEMCFVVDEVINFDVYTKLSYGAMFVIYVLFVAAIYGFLGLILSIFDYIFVKKDSWY